MTTHNAINTDTIQFLRVTSNLADVNNKVASFNSISPITTKGDLIAYDGTNNVRLAVGTNGYVLVADSTSSTGFKWAAAVTGSAYSTVQNQGSALTQRATLNFSGAAVTAADDAANTATKITFAAPLNDVAGLTPSSNYVIVGNGSNFVTQSPTTFRGNMGAAASGSNSDITSLTGLTTALSIGQGGTGQTTANAAFNALSPNTTKGDLTVYGTSNVRLPVGSDGSVLMADSSQTTGVKWGSISGYLLASNNLSDLASASTARTNLGLGSIATQSASSVAITGGSIANASIKSYTETTVIANSGAAYAFDLSQANVFVITLTANCTFSITNVPATGTSSLTIELVQDGTGSRTATWPGSIIWGSGTAPTLQTAAGGIDFIDMITTNGGTSWRASPALAAGGSAGYTTIDNLGTGLTARSVMNFASTGLTAVDNSGSSRTDISLDSAINAWTGYSTNGILAHTAANTYGSVTLTGTSNQITVANGDGVAGNPTFSISSTYPGQTSITTLGTITAGTWNGGILSPTYGGTGINNGTNSISVSGNFQALGATTLGSVGHTLTLNTTANTTLTLPTSGTLVNTNVATLSNLSWVGTVTNGTWNSNTITVGFGGTGNSSFTPYGVVCGGTGTQTHLGSISPGTTGQLLVSAGASAYPAFASTISPNLQNYTETGVTASSAGTYTIDLSTGNIFTITLTANTTLSFTNVPATNAASITLNIKQDATGGRTITWPAAVIWPGATAPTLTTTASHVDQILMTTTNAGTTWRAAAILNFSA